MSPSPLVSHSSCTGHHYLVTVIFFVWLLLLKTKHSSAEAPGGCFVTSPRPPLSFSPYQSFPCWKHEQDKDWLFLTLLGQKHPGI